MPIRLTAIVPVYNEAATVAQVLAKLARVKACQQIIIVNDGSTDQSGKLIEQFVQRRRDPRRWLYLVKANGGKGSAIRQALAHVTNPYVVIQDADTEYDPDDIPLLVKPIEKHRAEVVYGSRFFGPHNNLLFWHRVGNHLINLLVNVLYNTTLSDLETCYKLIPTARLRQLPLTARGFEFEPEVTCRLLQHGVRIYEVPISYSGRDFSQGKKITWQDGIIALRTIVWIWLQRTPKP